MMEEKSMTERATRHTTIPPTLIGWPIRCIFWLSKAEPIPVTSNPAAIVRSVIFLYVEFTGSYRGR